MVTKSLDNISKKESNPEELEQVFLSIKNLKENRFINSRFQIKERLGIGGFGVVFKGYDTLLKKDIALKFLSPKVTENERKFLFIQVVAGSNMGL
jgi:serine/threonine protein kinase